MLCVHTLTYTHNFSSQRDCTLNSLLRECVSEWDWKRGRIILDTSSWLSSFKVDTNFWFFSLQFVANYLIFFKPQVKCVKKSAKFIHPCFWSSVKYSFRIWWSESSSEEKIIIYIIFSRRKNGQINIPVRVRKHIHLH